MLINWKQKILLVTVIISCVSLAFLDPRNAVMAISVLASVAIGAMILTEKRKGEK